MDNSTSARPAPGRQRGDRAVVIGASMAGLLTARVLSDHYREVVVVDRDEVLGVAEPRRGTPHTHHAHGLHGRGHLTLEALFPGLTQQLVSRGVPTGDLGEMRWFFDARQIRPAHTGLLSVTAPRPVLECTVRDRVAALPAVTFRQGWSVETPRFEDGKVTGVLLHGPAGEREDLGTDLLVDATGRGSRSPVWLSEQGYGRPAEDQIKIGLAYTTRLYRSTPEMFDGVQSINPVASPNHPRGAFFGQIGPELCILSLTGILGDHPPTDEQGFLDFVRSLPVPDVWLGVRDAEPLTDPVRFGFPRSVRRRYDRMDRLPEGMVVIGDALCSFNPVYGQGMSVAALEAVALGDHLSRNRVPRPRELARELGRVVENPWQISAGGDLDFPGVEGPRTTQIKVVNAYMARMQFAATRDPRLTDAFMRVAGLMDPPTRLLKPVTVARVLRHAPLRPEPGPVTPIPGEQHRPDPAGVPAGPAPRSKE